MFLRPTESLTVFLQQLGRGLRHAPGKECLTVLDFVGQTHRRYRLDTKFTALLSGRRQRLDREVEADFPSLPPGCSIQLERVARDRVLSKIRSVLADLNQFIPETLRTWSEEVGKPLTFGRFLDVTGLTPVQVLSRRSWSEWKALADRQVAPEDPDIDQARKALPRIALRSDPGLLSAIETLGQPEGVEEALGRYDKARQTALHYLLWGQKGGLVGVESLEQSLQKWHANPSIAADAAEIAAWRRAHQQVPLHRLNELPFDSELLLHGAYGTAEIKAALGLSSLEKPGATGVGVIHAKEVRAYIHLVTFQKDDSDFSPTTRYRDYPISRTLLHWESQSNTTQDSTTGQNYLNSEERGYTILFFARLTKRIEDKETAPFIFLGQAKALKSYQGDRPIAMTWELAHPMPAELFEEARPA
jgi:hypothetical protein